MPRFRKLSEAEIAALDQPALGARAQIAREYDAYVAGFTAGDYGQAELASHERRSVVRQRLHAAARRRGLILRFRPGPSPRLIFQVEAAPPAPKPTAPVVKPAPAPAAGADQRRTRETRQQNSRPERPPRRRQTAASRYHEVLPRWMREGQQNGGRNGDKRRKR